jgi:hypothetical protein
MCLIELSFEAAISFATAALTSSIAEGLSAEEFEGMPSRQGASLAASETPSKIAMPMQVRSARLILSRTLQCNN